MKRVFWSWCSGACVKRRGLGARNGSALRRSAATTAMVIACLCVLMVARADLCPKCKDGRYTMDIGQCAACKEGHTSSGAFKLCQACSGKFGKCERCGAVLGAASKVSPEQAQERIAKYREEMEQEQPGCTKSPGADVEKAAAGVVTKWFEAMNKGDVPAALALSAVPFGWDRKIVPDKEGLEKLLTNWVVDKAPKKGPLKFSAPTFLCVAAVMDVGEGLVWIVAFDQSGRTDDAITFFVKPGKEPKIVGFRG